MRLCGIAQTDDFTGYEKLNKKQKGCTQDDSLAVQPFDPWAIRTPDPFLRREVLYPAELKDQRCIG